jgi:hypothetical protein
MEAIMNQHAISAPPTHPSLAGKVAIAFVTGAVVPIDGGRLAGGA